MMHRWVRGDQGRGVAEGQDKAGAQSGAWGWGSPAPPDLSSGQF